VEAVLSCRGAHFMQYQMQPLGSGQACSTTMHCMLPEMGDTVMCNNHNSLNRRCLKLPGIVVGAAGARVSVSVYPPK
jgi:hypothetical protein